MSKKNRKFRHQGRHQPVPRSEVLPPLDLGFLDAAPVTTREWHMVQILVVGAGGIGAYMVQHIGRLMRVLYQENNGVHLTICDPDVVEDKNIGRQLFCDAEIGVPKAEAVARRYGHAWGLNVSSYVGKYDESLLIGADLTVLVGCVDNAAAREDLNETLYQNGADPEPGIFWLDCGNLTDTGRVLLGTACEPDQLRGAFQEKKCYRLPGPAMQSPGLLEPGPDELGTPEMSCAEMAAANLQSLTINSRIASEAADFLARLLITKDLKRFGWECNLAAGSAKSHYTTPEAVAHLIRQPVEFVKTGTPQIAEPLPDYLEDALEQDETGYLAQMLAQEGYR